MRAVGLNVLYFWADLVPEQAAVERPALVKSAWRVLAWFVALTLVLWLWPSWPGRGRWLAALTVVCDGYFMMRVRWLVDSHWPPRRQLAPGQRWRYSVQLGLNVLHYAALLGLFVVIFAAQRPAWVVLFAALATEAISQALRLVRWWRQ